MKKISPAQIKSAIDRLPRQSNASIEQVLVNARRLEIEPLVEACENELRTRGSLNLSGAEAEQAPEISARITGKALSEVIEMAFTEVAANPGELLILRSISEHPGTSHAEIGTVYKNRDLSLVIGHLIHYRFGYFRPLLTGAIQSDLLLERDKTSGKIEQVLVNARRLEIEPLVEACENELRTRGSLNLSGAEAEQALEISARITGKALSEVIEMAFTEVAANPGELLILRSNSRAHQQHRGCYPLGCAD